MRRGTLIVLSRLTALQRLLSGRSLPRRPYAYNPGRGMAASTEVGTIMQLQSHEAPCAVCSQNSGEREVPGGILYADDRWVVLPAPPPYGVPGWMTLQTRRHVAGPAQFNHAEAASFGPVLCYLERVLEEITGALRIYTAAMGESFPHFHCRMVPRYVSMPNDAKGWGVFSLPRLATEGLIVVDESRAVHIIERYRAAIVEHFPPYDNG